MAHQFDALVLITNCDKINPAMLMAAAASEHTEPRDLRRPDARRRGDIAGPGSVDLSTVFEAVGKSITRTIDLEAHPR